MTEQRHLIWSNYDLDYEDWRDDLEEDHPELTEDERMALMYEINNRYLDDERVNLNIQLDQPILVIADLGLWNGRRTGYQEISGGSTSSQMARRTARYSWSSAPAESRAASRNTGSPTGSAERRKLRSSTTPA